eukprot:179306-Prorocentrum_minimum.AAC.6
MPEFVQTLSLLPGTLSFVVWDERYVGYMCRSSIDNARYNRVQQRDVFTSKGTSMGARCSRRRAREVSSRTASTKDAAFPTAPSHKKARGSTNRRRPLRPCSWVSSLCSHPVSCRHARRPPSAPAPAPDAPEGSCGGHRRQLSERVRVSEIRE